MPFTLTRTGEAKIERPPKTTPITKDLAGSWEGALDVDGKILRLVLKLSNQPDADCGGRANGRLKLVVPAVAGNYEGDLKEGLLTGTWTQGPRTWPLVFKQGK